MTVDQALEFFGPVPALRDRLQTLAVLRPELRPGVSARRLALRRGSGLGRLRWGRRAGGQDGRDGEQRWCEEGRPKGSGHAVQH